MSERSIPIQIDHHGGIARIIISRPEKSNALTVGMQAEIISALQLAAATPETKAVVLTGAGSRTFCAGVDISEVRPEPPPVASRIRSHQMFKTCLAMIDCPKPVVAALNGHAVGAGCILALLADARLATSQASLSLPEISLGAPSFAGIAVTSRMLGDIVASDLVQSGRRMGATEATSRGVIVRIYDQEELAKQAQIHALTLAKNSPLAFRLNKAWLLRETRLLLERAQLDTDDVRDAVAADRRTRAAR